MRDRSEGRPSPDRGAGRLPYDDQDWNRRLAEARSRRAQALRQRAARPPAAAASERLAAAWDGDPGGLAQVTRPDAWIRSPEAPHLVPSPPPQSYPTSAMVAARASDPVPSATADARSAPAEASRAGRAWTRPTLMLIAGCIIGATLTGLVAVGSGAFSRKELPPAHAGSLLDAPSRITGPASPLPPDRPVAIAAETRPEPPENGEAHRVGRVATTPAETLGAEPVETAAVDAAPAHAPAGNAEPEVSAEVGTGEAEAPGTAASSTVAASLERVVILAPRSVSRGGREEAAAILRDTGWPAHDPRTSPFTISRTHVRYYHASDRPAAQELAALFSAEARDFTSHSPRPEAGMVELWLAGRAPARRGRPPEPALPAFLARLGAIFEGR